MTEQTIARPPAGAGRDGGMSRRGLMARAGLASAAAALGTGLLDVGGDRRGNSADAATLKTTFGPNSVEKKFVVTDQDILTFALNTEYFEATFYSMAVTGAGLAANMTGGILGYGPKPNQEVAAGAVTTYSNGPVPFVTPYVKQFAAEIAADEVGHVQLLRGALGKHAPAAPAADLKGAFTTAMLAAGVIPAGTIFDPFASERNFLLAAYFINDIGVTAYVGAAPYLTSAANLAAAAGILGVEAYHAGETRTVVYAMGEENNDVGLLTNADTISTLRNKTAALSGAPPLTDEGITGALGQANIIPTDGNSLAFGRGFPALLSLFYLNTVPTLSPAPGGFIPSGLNGRIR